MNHQKLGIEPLRSWGRRLRLLLLPLLILLSSCLQSDLTLRFDHQTHGQILQSINLSERGAALARDSLNPWLASLEQPVQQLGGTLRQDSQTIALSVPFSTSQDLVERFDQLFGTVPAEFSDAAPQLVIPRLGTVPFRLGVDQHSWGVASRTHLTYDLDLRELPANEIPGSGAKRPWAELYFSLQTPWGVGQVLPTSLRPVTQLPTETRWQLQPGELNHIDVDFWLPNAVGIGTVIILVMVLGGYFLRYRLLG
ncbi:MAG: DUF3153 domain-containing protein [Nodosilinea sp.]